MAAMANAIPAKLRVYGSKPFLPDAAEKLSGHAKAAAAFDKQLKFGGGDSPSSDPIFDQTAPGGLPSALNSPFVRAYAEFKRQRGLR